MSRAIGAGMQRHIRAEYCRRAITRIIVGKGSDAGPYLSECFHPGARLAGKDIISPAHREREPTALRQHDTGRPQLDFDLVDLPGYELLLLVMGVVRPVGECQLSVKLAKVV